MGIAAGGPDSVGNECALCPDAHGVAAGCSDAVSVGFRFEGVLCSVDAALRRCLLLLRGRPSSNEDRPRSRREEQQRQKPCAQRGAAGVGEPIGRVT
jgi:hypothetical protein